LDGRLEVFVVWNNGVIGVIRQNSPNGGWSQWQAFPLDNFSTQLQPAVGRNADGHLELFATRLGEIYHIWQTSPNGAWSNWRSMNFVTPWVSPAVAANGDGRLEVFAVNTEGIIHRISQTSPNNGWSKWQVLDSNRSFTSEPVAASNLDCLLDIFVVDTGGTLQNIYQTAPNNGWSNWQSLGGNLEIQHLSVGRNADSRLEVFAKSRQRELVHIWQVRS
jgi:hypothetical protein